MTNPSEDRDRDDRENDSTRTIVLRLRDDAKRAEGAANVWRTLGGIAATVAIILAGAALSYAQQAAVDHEVVARHEREIDASRETLSHIQQQLSTMTAILERVERRIDRREEQTP